MDKMDPEIVEDDKDLFEKIPSPIKKEKSSKINFAAFMDQMKEEVPPAVVDREIKDKSPAVSPAKISPIKEKINFASFMDQMNEETDHTKLEKSKLITPQVEKII